MQGRIKLHRQTVERWRYKKPNMFHCFFYLIMKANHKDARWEWVDVKRWQAIIGREQMSKDTGISEQSIRTCLKNLQSTWEIIVKSTNKFTIVTIVKYCDYNDIDCETNQQLTSNQPATNQQLTTNKNDKKKKEWKEDYPPNFEEFRLHFPHARPWSKKKSFLEYSVLVEQEIRRELDLLRLRIDIWEVDWKYLPACERRLREFTPISNTIRTKSISHYRLLHKEDPKKEELYKRWIDNYPEQRKAGSEEFRKSQSINLSSFK